MNVVAAGRPHHGRPPGGGAEAAAAGSVTTSARKTRRIAWAGAAALVTVVIIAAFLVFGGSHHAVPRFPSLTAHPDPSLHGTVAYFTTHSCVEAVSASGRFSKQVLCIAPDDVRKPQADSKPIGPQLVWRADGRLEVTMFRMSIAGKGRAPTYSAGWQKVVDLRTGAVTQTPAADLPRTWNTATRPTTNGSGQTVSISNSPAGTGKITITLTEADGRQRTLLSAQGPGEYTYHLYAAFWSPDGQLIAADDGRILIITPENPAVTRVLVERPASGGFSEVPARANFAITTADLLGG